MVSAGAKTVNTDADVGSQISGALALQWATATISTDSIVASFSAVAVGAESGATQDTLQYISATATAVYSGSLLILKPRHATEEINLIHATSTAATATAPNVYLNSQTNYLLDTRFKSVTLQYDSQVATATGWYEISRSVALQVSDLLYQFQATSGAAGPTYSSGAWRTVTLNTEVVDTGGIGSLSSNQVTLPAGTYEVFGAVVYGSPAAGGTTRARIYNVSDTAEIIQGPHVTAGTGNTTFFTVFGSFTLTGTKIIELQAYPNQTINAGGAVTTGESEIYASLFLRRLI